MKHTDEALTLTRDLVAVDLDHDRERDRRALWLHGRSVPMLRIVGATLLVAIVALHNAWIRSGVNVQTLLGFAALVEAYALLGWILLRADHPPDRLVARSNTLLVADLVPLALAVHLTGGTESWIFWIFLVRVADQAGTSMWRALAFTGLGALAYGAVAAYSAFTGFPPRWSAEAAKILFLLLAGGYLSATTGLTERMRARLSRAARSVRRSVAELRQRSRELEEARETAARARADQSAFLARLGSELRGPVHGLLEASGRLAAEAELTDPQWRNLGAITETSRHLLDVINEVIDMARVETGSLAREIEPVPLAPALADVLERARSASRVRNVELPADPPAEADIWVAGSARKVRQVFANLISNAIKYSAPPGRVDVTCTVESGAARVRVRDTGPGIPEDRIEEAFSPFERLGAEKRGVAGTGLGLPLSRALVRAMGGRIGVETNPEGGSTFWFELPTVEPPGS